ncbi:MAG: RecX family transcriptional regulator [Bryobacterales bacterium]|nr:RecX family transcriptional regulator [Bryobacterales bacterium]
MDEETQIPARLGRDDLLDKALRLLGKQDYAHAEIEARLRPRAHAEADVSWVMAKLSEAGFLDDARVAGRKALQAREQRLVGRKRAEEDLRMRQLRESAVAEGIQSAYHGVDERDLALRFLREKLAGFLLGEKLEEPKQLQRAYGRLRRAGFAHADSVRALRKHSRLAMNLDEFAGNEASE